MTLRDTFRTVVLGQPPIRDTQLGSSPYARTTPSLASPFTEGQLQAIVWADVNGGDYAPLTRATAMAVPAVAKLRHKLCSVVSRSPLVSMTGDVKDAQQPPWMQRTDTALSPWHRMVWTTDDLLFYGWSLWAARRGAPSDGSPLLDAVRVPYERWDVDANGYLQVDGQPVLASQAILIPGPHAGLLNDSSTIIRLAADNLQAAANAARNPNPNVDLHYTGDEPMKDEDVTKLLQVWADARRGLNGGVGFTNKLVEARVLGSHLDKLLIEGRNADAVDVARAGGVPASVLDATSAGASLTYETTEGRNQEFLDDSGQFYMDAITARLSQDDCVPRGHRTAFDVTQFTTLTPSPTGAPTSD
jgi:hypothetical protein